MIIFFDLGQGGAVSYFNKNELIKVVPYQLSTKAKKSIKTKLLEFHNLLTNLFKNCDQIEIVGCHKPLGTNRNTIIHLAMMSTVLIFFFSASKFCFLNEWNCWKEILIQKTIPKRKIKKSLTIKWAEKKFNLQNINDDQADALLGGYFLTKIKF